MHFLALEELCISGECLKQAVLSPAGGEMICGLALSGCAKVKALGSQSFYI